MKWLTRKSAASGEDTVRADPPIVDEPPEVAILPSHPKSDEGVAYDWLAHPDVIVNFATDAYDSRRRELHVEGRCFSHVEESLEGHWIYRHD